MNILFQSSLLPLLLILQGSLSFQPQNVPARSSTNLYGTKPKRLEENAPGILYVNDKCINCSACSQFAPETFKRSSITNHHIVHQQPPTDTTSIDDTNFTTLQNARAAMAACPVSAIRSTSMEDEDVENIQGAKRNFALNPKVNNLPLPFPKVLWEQKEGEDEDNDFGIWFLGHHCEGSFGAMPYFVKGRNHNGEIVSVIVDVPRCTASSIEAVKSLLPPNNHGKIYMLLTHVDDTADHQKWKEEFPDIKRIFHSGDLGSYNWIGDESLEDVEVLLHEKSNVEDGELVGWSLDGDLMQIRKLPDIDESLGSSTTSPSSLTSLMSDKDAKYPGDFLILHTPGHTPGSISLLFYPHQPPHKRSHGTIFTGDTLAYTTRDGGHMTGFPLYAKEDRSRQVETLHRIQDLSPWYDCIAPGHGHVRDYKLIEKDGYLTVNELKHMDIEVAVKELLNFSRQGVYM